MTKAAKTFDESKNPRKFEYAIRGAIRNGWVRRVKRGVYALTAKGRRRVEQMTGGEVSRV